MSLPSGFLPKSKKWLIKTDLDFNSNVPLLYQMLNIRRKQNKDSIVVVVGEKRTGKSWFCGSACEYLSRLWKVPFGVDDVFFELKGLFKFMFASTDSLAVMEEAGLLLNAQEWAQIEARLTRNMTQTQGFRRNVIFLNLPHFGFLNKSMRLMTTFIVKTLDIGKVEVYRVNVNQAMGNGYLTKLEVIDVAPPSKEWTDAYEAKKKEYNDHWLQSDIEIFDLLDGSKKREKPKRPFPYSTYLDGFKKGSIPREIVKEKLLKMNFDPSELDLVLESVRPKIEDAYTQRNPNP